MRSRLVPFVLPLAVIGALGCGVGGDGGGPGGGLTLVDPGKADDFYSDVAYEFEVTGTTPVTISDADWADETKRAEVIDRRLSAIGVYLTTFVTDKLDEYFDNPNYGGFDAMVRNRSFDDLVVSGDPTAGVTVSFTVDVAGPPTLVDMLGGDTFDLVMPKDATISDGDELSAIRGFDPATYTGETETLSLSIRALPQIADAYPAYDYFVGDGLYDITLFQGHDYNDERTDLIEGFIFFYYLANLGFDLDSVTYGDTPNMVVKDKVGAVLAMPDEATTDALDRFARLTPDSGPLTRTIQVGGRDVRVEVRIFHSEMFTDDRVRQHDLALSEITTRDVFFYNGHAGPYYGFYLDAAGEAQVGQDEFATAPFTDKQQLVIAAGCQTYSQYADMLYAHPDKNVGNLDVITTVNFSVGQGGPELLMQLIGTGEVFTGYGNDRYIDGELVAPSYYALISSLNFNDANQEAKVFYGVTGIDENDHLHPFANVDAIGRDCTTHTDCGSPSGNLCIDKCMAIALSEDACPAGTVYRNVADGEYIFEQACAAAP